MFFLSVIYHDSSCRDSVFDSLATALGAYFQEFNNEDVYSVSLDYCRD